MSDQFKQRLLVLPLAVVALDQWTKWLIERELSLYDSVTVIPGFFSITNVANTGIAFGLFRSRGQLIGTVLLIALALTALGVVSLYFARAHQSQRLLLVALALIMGGAIGNLVDRVMLRAVTDFLEFYVGQWSWPTFNVADSAICIGIVLLAWETLLGAPAGDSERSDTPSRQVVAGGS